MRHYHDIRKPARELPIALAHQVANCSPDDARLALLHKIFNTLSLRDQLRARWELFECHAAKRGERLAVVA